jgi:hypothetical protein
MVKSRRVRWVGNVAQTGEKKNGYRLLMGKLERKKEGRRWADNIKMDLRLD